MVLLRTQLNYRQAGSCICIHGGIAMRLEKEKQKNHNRRSWYHWQRCLAVCLAVTLVLSNLNFGSILTYATENEPKTFDIGQGVTAELEEGVLTITGNGDTYDFKEETAPFTEYGEEIEELVIEDGITYIGAYLFYGLGKLKGELTLPASIMGFGDYAFSGDSRDQAPAFTLIRNEFEDGEVVDRMKGDRPTASPSEATPSDSADPDILATSSDYAGMDHTAVRPSGYTVDYMTEQEIENPDTLFYEKQDGWFICAGENSSFIEAAQAAGYERADGVVRADLDGQIEVELPVLDGKVRLPECPEEITDPYGDEPLYTGEFAGWREGTEADLLPALGAGEYMEIREDEPLSLYSVWKAVSKYHLSVTAEREGDLSTYTLVCDEADVPLDSIGYALFYQWQTAPVGVESRSGEVGISLEGIHVATPSEIRRMPVATASEGDYETPVDGWTDIEGATGSTYQCSVNADDAIRQFRCVVTAEKLMRSSGGTVKLYSDTAVSAAAVKTLYVNQKTTEAESAMNGTEEHPFDTIEKAAAQLTPKVSGGSVDTNHIILLADYKENTEKWYFLEKTPIPVTISGFSEGITLKAFASTGNTNGFYLYEDIAFENIYLDNIGHIYGNGHCIKFGEGIRTDIKDMKKGETLPEGANPTNGVYLYGFGQDSIEGIEGKIEVYSGYIMRIAGYARSPINKKYDAGGKESIITVGGSAKVDTIIAGCASGPTKNANVKINITGGELVGTLIGGNQGFNNNDSPFNGKTAINISGGNVTTVLGAGSGRNISIPTYSGTMDIHITGGVVGDVYGSGTAAYVISGESDPSVVNITAEGGTINNIYAAGVGGAGSVGVYQTKVNDETVTKTLDSESAKFCGSLTGNANITINGATVTGSIYASGQGYGGSWSANGNPTPVPYGQKSAFLKGNVTIKLESGEVQGNIYGGGKGISTTDYETCARVEAGSNVKIEIAGGTVNGNVYGGGEIALSESSPIVTLTGGTVKGNIYGGGKSGLVEGKTTVNIANGTVENSVYGGALGTLGKRYVHGGSTINMTGGWVRGNLYGGSELSDDGPEGQEGDLKDLIFVNLVGGTVSGKVFGGGYQGIVNGSTHVHIGLSALDKCMYYSNPVHTAEKPVLEMGGISVGSSIYAGGDYGGNGNDYDTITVNGFSHVYIDGTGYSIGGDKTGTKEMSIAGGVFGSGASCDAGEYRLVTLDNWGSRSGDQVSGRLTSIQRADQVRLINSHVELAGQSDAANANQTALYSLNRIGDRGNKENLGKLGNSLVLKNGSTLVLDSASIEMANFKSVDDYDKEVILDNLSSVPNTIILTTGTVFRVSRTTGDKEEYGAVSGYTYMMAGDTAEAYAYARVKTEAKNKDDGGFVGPSGKTELDYTNVKDNYRYWQLAGANASAERDTVLTAEKLDSPPKDGFSVAKGVIDLPPAGAGSKYRITSIHIPTDITLVEAVKQGDSWISTGTDVNVEKEKGRISASPLSAFGLYMKPGKGFSKTAAQVVSVGSAVDIKEGGIIGAETEEVTDDDAGTSPEIEFYLTYLNDGITASKNVGTVEIQLQRIVGNKTEESIQMNVEIVTKAVALSEQDVDLYATQTGNYTGKLVIPSGMSRTLKLTGVASDFPGSGTSQTQLISSDTVSFSNYKIAVTMQPVKSQGWNSAGLMEKAYDLSTFKADSEIPIGSTDSRYEAAIDFTLYNAKGFTGKNSDKITLSLTDENNNTVPIRLNIHWQDSVVSGIEVGPGKQYNQSDMRKTVTISQNSAVTAAFTVNSSGDDAANMWLELQKGIGEAAALPEQTKLTLLKGDEFYFYQVIGTETGSRIPLTAFKKMQGTDHMNGTIKGETLTVIADFDSSAGTGGLGLGNYSLRLRNDTGADSMGADFTVDNSVATVDLGKGVDIGNDQYNFSLTLTRYSDTRLTDGAALVLSAKENSRLPDGVIFKYGGKKYVPVGGKVYMVLTNEKTIIMDYTNVPEPDQGEKELIGQIFSIGANSGSAVISTVDTTYSVTAKPSYGLKVSLSNSAERLVKPGDNLKFTINYSVDREGESITIAVKKKVNGGYVDYGDWKVTKMDISKGTGARENSITVPANTGPGTYRLIFKLGDKEVPYNVIVQSSDGS